MSEQQQELAAVITAAEDVWQEKVCTTSQEWSEDIADAILAAGYRKPKVLGYIVVDRGGIFVGNQHKHRESAQAFADEWTADCKRSEMDWDYRVTEIVEARP